MSVFVTVLRDYTVTVCQMYPLFVYGTLKRGFPNCDLMKGAHFVGEYQTKDKLPLVIDGPWNIPYLIEKPGMGHHVRGEVFLVNDEQLSLLDRFEGVPHHYLRKQIVVVSSSRNSNSPAEIECFVYMKASFSDQLLSKPFLVEFPRENNYVPTHQRKVY